MCRRRAARTNPMVQGSRSTQVFRVPGLHVFRIRSGRACWAGIFEDCSGSKSRTYFPDPDQLQLSAADDEVLEELRLTLKQAYEVYLKSMESGSFLCLHPANSKSIRNLQRLTSRSAATILGD